MWTEEDRTIMGKVYKLLQVHHDPIADECYWTNLVGMASRIAAEHKGSELALDMCCAALLHREKKWERKKAGA